MRKDTAVDNREGEFVELYWNRKDLVQSFTVLLVEELNVYSMQGCMHVSAHLRLGRQLSQQVPVPHKALVRLRHTGTNVK